MVIAGEVSGDMRAAGLIHAFKQKSNGWTFFGIGGQQMRAEGVETFYDTKDMAVMGFSEVLRRIVFFRRVFYEMLDLAKERKPAAVILVDYPGFNLRFAGKIHAMGIKTIYYVCPQVWAWNRRRIPAMARSIDRLITIFPFELEYFKGTGVKADFVGHPLVDEIQKFRAEKDIDLPWQGKPKVALLPGSRTQEILKILPVMLDAAMLVRAGNPHASFIIASPSDETGRFIMDHFPSLPEFVTVVSGKTRQVLGLADAALVASGTATVETAMMGCPMVVVYKMSWLTYLLGRLLVRLKDIGMVNIIAGRRICPEFVQNNATPGALAKAIAPLLSQTTERTAMIDELARVRQLLGEGRADEKAAEILLGEISE
jgi:lipid-A-disaccharide synthase